MSFARPFAYNTGSTISGTEQIVFFSDNYYDCIDWIENYGDILNYTIIE